MKYFEVLRKWILTYSHAKRNGLKCFKSNIFFQSNLTALFYYRYAYLLLYSLQFQDELINLMSCVNKLLWFFFPEDFIKDSYKLPRLSWKPSILCEHSSKIRITALLRNSTIQGVFLITNLSRSTSILCQQKVALLFKQLFLCNATSQLLSTQVKQELKEVQKSHTMKQIALKAQIALKLDPGYHWEIRKGGKGKQESRKCIRKKRHAKSSPWCLFIRVVSRSPTPK